MVGAVFSEAFRLAASLPDEILLYQTLAPTDPLPGMATKNSWKPFQAL
jgi:hypothetical protein